MYTEKRLNTSKIQNFMVDKNPDGVGKVGNIICGDFIVLSIKVKKDKNKEMIQDIKFETYGC